MAKRRGSKTKSRSRVKRSKVSRKSVKRKGKSKRKSRSKSKAKKVSNILSSTYGLAGMYKENQKGYKGQRVAKKDPYKISKKKSSSSKAAKDSFLAGIDPKPSKKGNWIEHVKSYWEERRKSEPGYKYKDAMKDAKKTW